MIRALLLLLLLGQYTPAGPVFPHSGGGGGGTFTLVQHPSNTVCTTGATTCTVTTTATGAGNLIIAVAVMGNVDTVSSMSNSGGSAMTFTHCSSCSTFVPGTASDDAWYSTSSTSGNTSFTFTFASSLPGSGDAFEIIELSSTTSISLDTQGSAPLTTVAPTGITLTLSGTNDFIVQWAFWSGSLSGAPSPYTAIAEFPHGNVVAAAINTTNGTGPAFTPTTTGAGAFGALAFKD